MSINRTDYKTPEKLHRETLTLVAATDASRKNVNGKLKLENRSALGQFMTPATLSSFMAALFPQPTERKIRLLDPGAGVGSLTSAFISNIGDRSSVYDIDVDAYEIDALMRQHLEINLNLCKSTVERNGGRFSWQILSEDFVVAASETISSAESFWAKKIKKYTHCLMNPPYKKISSVSRHRRYLRSVGIETVNLYSAFIALALTLMEPGGYLVAIVPRSFCNGPYYRPFREYILKHSAIRYIHLFAARNKAFKEDGVLQENIIIMLEQCGEQHEVTVSTSTDDTFTDITTDIYPFDQIVLAGDAEMFFHIPTAPGEDFIDASENIRFSLADLGIQISTGPVVSYRLKKHLRKMPEFGTVPMLYPCHFSHLSTEWPIESGNKPNAIQFNHDTEKWLYPNGYYTVVRRFSSKEEKRRIVASVVDPNIFDGAERIGLENHLNVFHAAKKGLPEALARGLAVYLNSTAVDDNFRRFSGHTQVNATDLKMMKYPHLEELNKLGYWAMKQNDFTQDTIDTAVEKIII